MGTLKVQAINDHASDDAIANITGINNIQAKDAMKKDESVCFIEMTSKVMSLNIMMKRTSHNIVYRGQCLLHVTRLI